MNNFIENLPEGRGANELEIEINTDKWGLWTGLKLGLGEDEDAKVKTKICIEVKVESLKGF